LRKLDTLRERRAELDGMLAAPEVIADQGRFRGLSIEYAEIAPVVDVYSRYRETQRAAIDAEALLDDGDAELRALAQDEVRRAREDLSALETELRRLLIPRDPDDSADVYLEIRAGTGGDEAGLFAGNLLRMYLRYAEGRGWQTEIMSANEAELGGYKEVIVKVSGHGVYARLKFESGAHRVQRVPDTESQGRIHTSACTVAIMPAVAAVDDVEINPGDLRIDTFRASGAGGQHVNKTDSAIRITHLPTGVVVECQDERSQHKNRARAMSLLKARLLAAERARQQAEQATTRRNLVGSGVRAHPHLQLSTGAGHRSPHQSHLVPTR